MANVRRLNREEWPKNSDAPFRDSCVYVVADGSFATKIGIASHPIRRLSDLQVGNPRPLRLVAIYIGERVDCRRIEKSVHMRFIRERITGEWFDIDWADACEAIENHNGGLR